MVKLKVNLLKLKNQLSRCPAPLTPTHFPPPSASPSPQGLNAALFYENKDPRTFVSLVPTSAHSGDGMGNLIALLVELTQTMLARRLAHCDELRAQVMEVREPLPPSSSGGSVSLTRCVCVCVTPGEGSARHGHHH